MKKLTDGIIGLVVGDAVGVPVEFQSRDDLDNNPVVDMREYGTYHQPKGTWSDDSSLTLCLASSLLNGYDVLDMSEHFIDWYRETVWTPHGQVFDIGGQTRRAICRLERHIQYNDADALLEDAYQDDEFTNGNGSLMRILPLYQVIRKAGIEDSFEKVRQVSALTHGHIHSALACFIYLVMVDELMLENDKNIAYQNTCQRVNVWFEKQQFELSELFPFSRLLSTEIGKINRNDIQSDGYVVHSLEAAFWCLLNSDNYKQTILNAVNLGNDTDTTAAIVGGLAGIYYGNQNIPDDWLKNIVRLDDICTLCEQLEQI